MDDQFSHYDSQGHSRMVDVSGKATSLRIARAGAFLRMAPGTRDRIRDLKLPKGDPFEVARIAGIMAAKKTHDLIPMCHPLLLTHVDVQLSLEAEGVRIETEVRCQGSTGVEMEALTAAAVAGLTLYDMCKAVDRAMSLDTVHLIEKHGGKSDYTRLSDKTSNNS